MGDATSSPALIWRRTVDSSTPSSVAESDRLSSRTGSITSFLHVRPRVDPKRGLDCGARHIG